MQVCVSHACLMQMSEERVGSPGTGIMDGCEPPRECWELNLVPLQEQQVLLISGHL